ncbi:DUF3307 domain-containing protein [Brevibacillus laterosporus]|uniref:DUF3307 domain-containing protein n=1 Tax=Brevibacillus laterosporus TaxID=1465 RepID=A0A502HAB8_BRELA|nr:DUF3307 domain-containing protein [Brevibacillus laterosporus]TPG70180.1 DUF3307 domain-containing protein [Brevibacillus laterosporus]TPG83574.1 DUF3307 domain-containing protein [Brevibacillus laterosporus]
MRGFISRSHGFKNNSCTTWTKNSLDLTHYLIDIIQVFCSRREGVFMLDQTKILFVLIFIKFKIKTVTVCLWILLLICTIKV